MNPYRWACLSLLLLTFGFMVGRVSMQSKLDIANAQRAEAIDAMQQAAQTINTTTDSLKACGDRLKADTVSLKGATATMHKAYGELIACGYTPK